MRFEAVMSGRGFETEIMPAYFVNGYCCVQRNDIPVRSCRHLELLSYTI
jgi:hypothetical protein